MSFYKICLLSRCSKFLTLNIGGLNRRRYLYCGRTVEPGGVVEARPDGDSSKSTVPIVQLQG